jgi:hypothetical protein
MKKRQKSTHDIVWTEMVGSRNLKIMSSAQDILRLLQGVLNLAGSKKRSSRGVLILIFIILMGETKLMVVNTCDGKCADRAI